MLWEVVIGLEVHAQLNTNSKIFSGAATTFGAAPNTQASAVDLALPGVLPVMNKAAVEKAIRFGLAIGATVAPKSVFARKNYFYPDLPKGYQISQFELPVVVGGTLTISGKNGDKVIQLTRAHLEEDAGKSLHEDFHGMTGIDLNRAGTPLLEIVSEPELRSSAEAVAYAKGLHALVRYLDICDGNMQEGSFRCDANVSVRPQGQTTLGTRCEIKNLNSFRFLEKAIDYEVQRQIALIEEGGKVVQETRLYDPERNETRSMRSKEDAQDYRYFPDPDLPPLLISSAWIEAVKADMPELPAAKATRFEASYALSTGEAQALSSERDTALYFEQLLAQGVNPKLAANWLIGEVAGYLNREGLEARVLAEKLTPLALAQLLARQHDGTISGKIAKEVFAAMWAGEGSADEIIAAKGLTQISDSSQLSAMVDEVLAANPKMVAEFHAGKEKAFNALVGQLMKASKGKANPTQVNELLRAKLTA